MQLDEAGLARALTLADSIEHDLRTPKNSILYELAASARAGAIRAAGALTEVDAEDAKRIRELQNDVRRFTGLRTWILNAEARAGEAFAALPPDEQEAVTRFLDTTTEINDA
jgi:signal transduction histidine kinase